ncbi:unnamed protein product [marine sediment metagenome]|uniref:Arsenite methyltransferase n=1 Tax=marine sediment metagenome TaxID=412755 RepID=X1D3W0_9ZZZZ
MTEKRKCSCSCNCNAKNNKSSSTYTENIKNVYDKVADYNCNFGGKTCGCRAKVSQEIGYTKKELEELADANLGLGCGNPIELGEIKPGQIVLDLGSGAGLDCFLAAEKIGETGKVIGVDITHSMIEKANKNKEKYGYGNVEFRLGNIESLPVENNAVDIIISNCVLSLAKNKETAFKEAYRVLKPGGVMYVSDIVLLRPLSAQQRTDTKMIGTCVLGALLKEDYIEKIINTGFEISIIDEDFEVNKKKFNDSSLPVSSLKYIATKPN